MGACGSGVRVGAGTDVGGTVGVPVGARVDVGEMVSLGQGVALGRGDTVGALAAVVGAGEDLAVAGGAVRPAVATYPPDANPQPLAATIAISAVHSSATVRKGALHREHTPHHATSANLFRTE